MWKFLIGAGGPALMWALNQMGVEWPMPVVVLVLAVSIIALMWGAVDFWRTHGDGIVLAARQGSWWRPNGWVRIFARTQAQSAPLAAVGDTLQATAIVSDPPHYTSSERDRLLDALGAIHDKIGNTLAPIRDEAFRLREQWLERLARDGSSSVAARLKEFQGKVRQASIEIDKLMDANSLHWNLFHVSVYSGGAHNPNHAFDSATAALIDVLDDLEGKSIDIAKYSRRQFEDWGKQLISLSDWIGRARAGIDKSTRALRAIPCLVDDSEPPLRIVEIDSQAEEFSDGREITELVGISVQYCGAHVCHDCLVTIENIRYFGAPDPHTKNILPMALRTQRNSERNGGGRFNMSPGQRKRLPVIYASTKPEPGLYFAFERNEKNAAIEPYDCEIDLAAYSDGEPYRATLRLFKGSDGNLKAELKDA